MFTEVALIVFLYMSVIFIVALIRKDNSIADVAWGTGFIVISLYSLVQSGEVDLRKMIVNLLVFLWGLRLSYHIMMRNMGRGEDFRYRNWRKTWKHFALRSYFQIFMLQGFFMLIISAPVWYINSRPGGLPGGWDLLGLILFGTGFFFEVIADHQLAVFRKDQANAGKILTTGLWSVSRHPNYFGEALLWWGIGCYSLSLPNGWMTLTGPLVITLLLRFVSGVPLLEKKYEGRPDWEAYKSATPAFFPYLKGF